MFENRFSKIYRRPWAPVALLLGFCFIFYFPILSQWELRGHDEIRYTQIAREIVERGDWISLHLHGRSYMDKPPLFFWLIAFSSYLCQGFTSFSARFPSAFFGTLTVLVTFFLGKSLYDSRTGFVSGLMLATSFLFARYSTRANIDVTLTFFTTASFFCFFQWFRLRKQESNRKMYVWRLSIYGFYVSMALATLTKGLIGLLFPLITGLVFLLIQKDWRGIRGMCLLPGLGLFLVIVLSWYLPALFQGGQTFLNETLFRKPVGYYLEGLAHVKPIYFYLADFPAGFFPWSLFLPGAMVYGYCEWAKGRREEVLYVFTWFIVIFLFLSFSAAKRSLYLLPLYPAASLIVSKLWGDFIFNQMENLRREWISLPFYGLIGLVFASGLIILWTISKRFPSHLLGTLAVTVFVVGASLVVFFLYRSQKYRIAFFLFVGKIAVGVFYTEHFLLHLEKDPAPFILNFIRSGLGSTFR